MKKTKLWNCPFRNLRSKNRGRNRSSLRFLFCPGTISSPSRSRNECILSFIFSRMRAVLSCIPSTPFFLRLNFLSPLNIPSPFPSLCSPRTPCNFGLPFRNPPPPSFIFFFHWPRLMPAPPLLSWPGRISSLRCQPTWSFHSGRSPRSSGGKSWSTSSTRDSSSSSFGRFSSPSTFIF